MQFLICFAFFGRFVVQCSVNAQQDVVVFVVHVLIFALPSILGAYHETENSEHDHICRMKYWIIYKCRYEIYIDVPMMEIESIRFECWNWILLSRLVLRFGIRFARFGINSRYFSPFPTPLVERIANLSHAKFDCAYTRTNFSVVRPLYCITAIMVLVNDFNHFTTSISWISASEFWTCSESHFNICRRTIVTWWMILQFVNCQLSVVVIKTGNWFKKDRAIFVVGP